MLRSRTSKLAKNNSWFLRQNECQGGGPAVSQREDDASRAELPRRGMGACAPGRDRRSGCGLRLYFEALQGSSLLLALRAIFAHSQNQQQQITLQTMERAPAPHGWELRARGARADFFTRAESGRPPRETGKPARRPCPAPAAPRAGEARAARAVRTARVPSQHGRGWRDSLASRRRAAGAPWRRAAARGAVGETGRRGPAGARRKSSGGGRVRRVGLCSALPPTRAPTSPSSQTHRRGPMAAAEGERRGARVG